MAKVPMPEVAWVSETFPFLASGKLSDRDVSVHSLGCSVWNILGHEQSFMAVLECPAPGAFGADIRSDSGWFHRSSASPVCLTESERFDGSVKGQQKLEEKSGNLLEAAQRWNHCPKTLVLSVWSQGLVGIPDTQKLKDICHMSLTSPTDA